MCWRESGEKVWEAQPFVIKSLPFVFRGFSPNIARLLGELGENLASKSYKGKEIRRKEEFGPVS
jgi:hypothetical protein